MRHMEGCAHNIKKQLHRWRTKWYYLGMKGICGLSQWFVGKSKFWKQVGGTQALLTGGLTTRNHVIYWLEGVIFQTLGIRQVALPWTLFWVGVLNIVRQGRVCLHCQKLACSLAKTAGRDPYLDLMKRLGRVKLQCFAKNIGNQEKKQKVSNVLTYDTGAIRYCPFGVK